MRQMRWVLTVATLVMALAGSPRASSAAEDRPLIDPDVRAGARDGTLRVLVELRTPPADPSALHRVQDEVLRGLEGTGARLARRYATAPVLALEVDAAALARLAAMPALVRRVRADDLAAPFEGPAPGR
jgi:hypothetical protein